MNKNVIMICPKALSCVRLATSRSKECYHLRPHKQDDSCGMGHCENIREMAHIDRCCTPMQFVKESNKAKLMCTDL